MLSSKRIGVSIALIATLFVSGSCGTSAQTAESTAEVTSAPKKTVVTEAIPKKISLTEEYYANLTQFTTSVSLDSLTTITEENWSSIPKATRVQPLEYFMENLGIFEVADAHSRQTFTVWAKAGVWHCKSVYDNAFTDSDIVWEHHGTATRFDAVAKENSGEQQIAILFAHYFPNVNDACLVFMTSGAAVVGDCCMSLDVIKNIEETLED